MIIHNADLLPLTALADFIGQREGVHWNNKGAIRIIFASQIRNALQTRDSWQQAVDAGITPAIPTGANFIRWDDCCVPALVKSTVEVVGDPRTDVVEAKSQSSTDTGDE